MSQRYEYKFVRLGEGRTGLKKSAKQEYQQAIHDHASEGWRLVQIFAPAIAGYGSAKYFEIIFERENKF
jgi:hypothetical protein